MSARDDRLKKQQERREASRFTTDDIVRAIEAVEQAGQTVYGVEITAEGSIKISTTSPFKRAATSNPDTSADVQDEVQPNKRRAGGS